MRYRKYSLWLTGAVYFFISIAAFSETKGVAPGLTLQEFSQGDAKGMFTVTISPKHYRLKILTASGLKIEENLSAKDWVRKYHLTAAINAGMYQKDYRTSVGLLLSEGRVNNAHVIKKYKAVLAFDPIAPKPTLPSVQIIDTECQNFDVLKPQYRSLLQGIRMVTCKQVNTWQEGGDKWPIAAIGTNKNGDILFLFSTTPLTPNTFIERALHLPLNLYNLMYLEGGPPAQFYLKSGKTQVDLTGSYSNQATEASLPIRTAIPNIIGIVPR